VDFHDPIQVLLLAAFAMVAFAIAAIKLWPAGERVGSIVVRRSDIFLTGPSSTRLTVRRIAPSGRLPTVRVEGTDARLNPLEAKQLAELLEGAAARVREAH